MTIILLVDDHALVRSGIKSMLDKQFGMRVVAEASTGREAINNVKQHKPDVVIMDISMPDMNGIDATIEIKKLYPNTEIIVLTGHKERHLIDEILKAGASGYLLKDALYDDLEHAIETVTKHEVFLSPSVAKLVVAEYLKKYNNKSVFNTLSVRERQVLQGLAEGKAVKELAGDMHVSSKTIESHRKNIMDKLDIRNIPELVKYAIREGITDLD